MRGFIGEQGWADLLGLAVRRRHPAGSLLLRQGESGTHVLAVLRGVTKVVRHERDGNLTLLAFRGPGELLGEVAVLDDRKRSASVEAISECVVGVVSRSRFLHFAEERDLFPVLVRYALNRLRESDQARSSRDVVARLAAVLVRLAESSQQLAESSHRPVRRADSSLELALTRDDLAQHLGISRNTVTSALGHLSEHVQVGRKRIVIDDLPALHRVLEGRTSGDP